MIFSHLLDDPKLAIVFNPKNAARIQVMYLTAS